ncbi:MULTISPECIES: FecR family protein [unclassified Dysgonomonas]|uniref:FecR family protein n=1 Tax=unclassified Dysgonomonas TaxID=2630389 RepID=UPI0024751209|nr:MULTISPECIES: FecR family protein [unclassified Dysgonomonas]
MDHEILQRYIEGNSTQQEKEDVARWLDADDKHMQEFLLLRNVYDVSLWRGKDTFAKVNEEHTEDSGNSNNKRRIKLVREFLKIAAVFLLALGCYHMFLSPNMQIQPNFALQTVYSPEGQRAEVVLSDGTKVWLNAKSSLTFPNEFSETERVVKLDGEAYFDVTHDDAKKFIVKTKEYQIKVHGTEFNVNAYGGSDVFETALIKGSVEVIANATDESIMLSPNNRVYAENNKLVLANLESQDQFLWKKGILYFENQDVKDIFEKLELYYDVKIDVRNREILSHKYQYTGKFWSKDGIEHVLKVLQLRHNFKYTKDDMNNITIY